MKDYVGETGCHITFFLRNAGVFAFQLQSLSMAFFRYICLFHSGSVRKLHISLNVSCKDQIMKPIQKVIFVSVWDKSHDLWANNQNRCRVPISNLSISFIFQTMAKLIFLINFLGPILSYAFVFTSEHTVGLDVCLGKAYFNFFSNQVDLCSYDSIYSKGVCMTIWSLYIIGSSNILDAYIIFCCLKEIRNSTEKQKQQLDPKL